MVKNIILVTLFLSIVFSGCASTGTVCTVKGKDPIRIEVFNEKDNVIIIRDRWDIANETIYDENVKITKDKISATKQKSIFMTTFSIFSPNYIKLTKDDNSVRTGNITYKCDENFKKEFEKAYK